MLKRIFLVAIFFVSSMSPAFSYDRRVIRQLDSGNMVSPYSTYQGKTEGGDQKQAGFWSLPPSLSFLKCLKCKGTGTKLAGALLAEFAVANPNAVCSIARSASAPTTWIDSLGAIRLVTDTNSLVVNGGYYPAATVGGFIAGNSGAKFEAAATNYILNSYFSIDSNSDGLSDSWTSTWGTRTRENSPINGLPNEKTQKVAYTFTGEPIRYTSTLSQNTGTDTFDASSANVKGYISFLAQGNLSGLTTGTSVNYWVHIEAVDNSNVYQESVVLRTFANASTDGLSPTIWKRFTFPFTVADTDARKLRCRFIYETAADGSRSQSGENFWLEVKDVQIEKGVVPTSFIPTTTAEVTRPAETLKYFNLGNSTKDKESIFISFTPRGTGFANDGVLRRLHGTDTKSRIIRGSLGGNVLDFYPNGTDSTSCMTTTSGASGTLNSLTKYATTMKHSSPYVSAYLNGLASGTPETADDFVNPAWGTYFFIGSQFNGTESFQGDISKVAKFSRALSASEVAAVDRFLNQ